MILAPLVYTDLGGAGGHGGQVCRHCNAVGKSEKHLYDDIIGNQLSGKTRRLAAEDDCPAAQTGASCCDGAVGGAQGEIFLEKYPLQRTGWELCRRTRQSWKSV